MSTTNLKTGEATTGSIWNKNSWHWEEKDYNKVAQSLIKEQIESLELVSPSGEQVKMKAVEPKGFCSISVRKGKKVIIFEFAINMEFVCGSTGGVVKIPEFSNDELDPVIRVEMKSENDSLKEFMRKTGADAIKRSLGGFVEFINTVDTGSEVLTSDKERREKELEIARKAEQEKGEEKKKIAEQVKEKERSAIAEKTLLKHLFGMLTRIIGKHGICSNGPMSGSSPNSRHLPTSVILKSKERPKTVFVKAKK